MKYIVLIVLFSFTFSACTKEQNRQLLNAYFKFKVDGAEVNINDGILLNDDLFECVLVGDTALYVDALKKAQGAGFAIKLPSIKDTTYVLDSIQRAYYMDPGEQNRYYTNSLFKGTLTIKRGTFQAKDMLNTMSGTFSYQVKDTLNNRIHYITDGSFFMERKEQ
jgi:hypothetical protein